MNAPGSPLSRATAAVRIPALTICIAALAVHAQSAEELPKTIGWLGEPDRLAFTGMQTLTGEAIVRGLRMDIDFLAAARPSAQFAGYLDTLGTKVRDGYLHAGFCQPEVTVGYNADDGLIIVNITEGPRVNAGGVVINGTETAPADRIIESLIEAAIPAGQPGHRSGTRWFPWEKGKPARCDDVTRADIKACVAEAFANCGYLRPRLNTALRAEPGEGVAELVIDVEDEGPKAVLGEIEVKGAVRNSRESILKYLELTPGDPLDGGPVLASRGKLERSARFLKCEVAAKPADDGITDLTIALVEYDKAPPLDQQFSPEEAMLLDLHRRMMSAAEGQCDLELTAAGLQPGGQKIDLTATLARDRGIAVTVRPAGKPDAPAWSIALDSDNAVFIAPAGKLEAPTSLLPWRLMLNLAIRPEPKEKDLRPFALNLRNGIGSRKSGQSPFELQLDLAPVAFVGMAHSPGSTCALKDGTLTIAGLKATATVSRQGDDFTVTGKYPDGVVMGARTGVGLFDRRLAEIREAGEALPDRCDPADVRGAAIRFALAQLLDILPAGPEAAGEPQQALARIIAKLPADAFTKPEAAHGEAFIVPQPPPHPMAGAAVAVMLASQELFQRDTWPVVLSRELALGICGKGADMAQVDALIRGREVGPASFLAMASIFGMLRNPAIARELAKQGIRELKPEGFRKDAAVIISGDRLLGKTALALAAALRESSDDDIQAIASRLNPAEAALLRDCARLLKATPDKPLADALAPALDAWWSAALRQPIGEALAGVAFDQE